MNRPQLEVILLEDRLTPVQLRLGITTGVNFVIDPNSSPIQPSPPPPSSTGGVVILPPPPVSPPVSGA
jgi:hypothetical protein